MAWRTKGNGGYKSSTDSLVQGIPLRLGRPCPVSREGLALASKSNAEEGESKQCKPRHDTPLAKKWVRTASIYVSGIWPLTYIVSEDSPLSPLSRQS